MRFHNIRFVHLLALFVSLAMSSLSVLHLLASYFEAKNSLYDTAFMLNYESALKMSVTMGSVFRSMESALRGNANHIAEQTLKDEDPQPHADHFMESNNFFNGLIVVDREGKVIAASDTLAGLKGTELMNETGRKALEARGPTLSAPYRSADGNPVVLMTYPIYDASGEYNGYIGGTIHLAEPNVLNDIFGTSPASGESGTYAYVVDPSGIILYHPDPGRLGDSEAANAVVQKLMRGQRGYEKVRNTRGKLYLAGFANVAENGWGIVVQTPVGEIHDQAYRVVFKEISYTLPFFALLLLVTFLMARRLAAPFSALAETADRLAAGYQAESGRKPAFLSREANQLHRTIMLAMDQLQKQAEHYLHESLTDPLTGLPNRRTMNMWISERTRGQYPFSIIMMDIDHFKRVNDTYGHQVGDEVLRHAARTMLSELRRGDCCCRYGGEEFAVLLPDTSIDDAFKIAERIRSKLEREISPTGSPVTISCGLAAWPDDADTAHALVEAADLALYEAKRAGRNRTAIYNREMKTQPESGAHA